MSIVKMGPWLACSFGALLWGGCGETEKNSHAEPAANSANGGSGGAASETASTTSAAASSSAGGNGNVDANSITSSTASAATTSGQGGPGSGGAPATTTTDQGAAGADPTGTGGAGTGGTGGTVEPDDGCEVKTFDIADDVCQVEASCVEFVQHTNCRLNDADMWQCDTDEHDNSKPHTPTGNPGWFNVVTGTSDAAAACDAVVAVNLHRSSVTAADVEDCSEFSIESESRVAHLELCGMRYHASSGAAVWKE